MAWEIEYYHTASGQEPVKDLIDKLQASTQAKVGHIFDLLEQYGYQVGMPHAKQLGNGLLELRVRGSQEVRIFYVFVKNNRIYLLHGFIKKTQTTPKKELELARKRQSEVEDL